jgi:hypothetical protein
MRDGRIVPTSLSAELEDRDPHNLPVSELLKNYLVARQTNASGVRFRAAESTAGYRPEQLIFNDDGAGTDIWNRR